MSDQRVAVFSPFPFEVGQKINITAGQRKGDWEVVGVTEDKVKLRCPITEKHFDWVKFCFLVEERTVSSWPQED